MVIEKRAVAAEKAAQNGRSKELNSMTKSITGERQKQEIFVKEKQGVLRTEIRERLQRWVEHLREMLIRDDPTNPMEADEIVEPEEMDEIDLGRWQEVKDALKRTKPGKAAGVDEVCPELSRADMEDTLSRLTCCYTRLWGKLRSGRKCGRKDLLLRYSRKVTCANATTGEE